MQAPQYSNQKIWAWFETAQWKLSGILKNRNRQLPTKFSLVSNNVSQCFTIVNRKVFRLFWKYILVMMGPNEMGPIPALKVRNHWNGDSLYVAEYTQAKNRLGFAFNEKLNK